MSGESRFLTSVSRRIEECEREREPAGDRESLSLKQSQGHPKRRGRGAGERKGEREGGREGGGGGEERERERKCVRESARGRESMCVSV